MVSIIPTADSNLRRRNSRIFLGCLLVGGIGFTVFVLAKRSSTKHAASPHIGLKTQARPANITFTELTPDQEPLRATESQVHYKNDKEQMAKAGGKRYLNTETWEIEWNGDGLPSKVTIHRDAVQK